MHPAKFFLLISLGTSVALSSDAQNIGPSAIDAAGTSVTAAGITHDYAIGQVIAVPTYSTANFLVTPGVLQPQFSTTGVSTLPAAISGLSVFPNPAYDILYL